MKILVAGCGKGIGKATADLAYNRGHEVIGITRGYLDSKKQREYKTHCLDLSVYQEPQCPDLSEEIKQVVRNEFSNPDTVINCTGTHIGFSDVKDWGYSVVNSFTENVVPAIALYETFLPEIRKKKQGHFIHISSAALDFPSENEAAYQSSKAALESLILGLHETDKPGIDKDESNKNRIYHHAVRVSLTDTPLARRVCPDVEDWNQFYTAEETAKVLIDIAENPEKYQKPIVTPLYRPIR